MRVVGTKWYLKVFRLYPAFFKGRWGHETEIVEYATIHWYKFGWFVVCFNDWSDH